MSDLSKYDRWLEEPYQEDNRPRPEPDPDQTREHQQYLAELGSDE